MLKRPENQPYEQSDGNLRRLRFKPGVIVVKWKQDVLSPAARRRGLKAAARDLPDTVRESIAFLRRNLGLKRVVDISLDTRRGAPRSARRTMAATQTTAVARSLKTEAGGLRGVTLLEFDPAAEVGRAMRALDPRVIEYVQQAPTRWLAAKKSPSDPRFNGQWGLPAIEWFFARRPNASAVRVAVLDSGVDRRHPDLRGVIASYDNGGFSAADLVGHGTHVSGIIAAKTNNKIGIAGVSNCKLHCWKVFSDEPESDGEIYIDLEAYYRALGAVSRKRGVKVLNLSLGGVEEDLTETDLIARLVGDDKVLVVAAMGNEYGEGNPIEYPAALPGVLAVGAIGANRRRSGTSNTGKHIGLMAPGVSILSTLPMKDSPFREEVEYEAWDGTSMATPFVTGVASLIWARRPSLTPAEVRDILVSKTTRLAAMKGKKRTNAYGSGLVNARKALDF